jgi:hypothetical protein
LRRKKWPLLTLIGLLIVAGGVFILKKITLLQLENLDRRTTLNIRVSPSESFSIFYIHSIYLEPVIEEFRIKEATIHLEGVRTKSPAVMEYYGFEDTKEFHPVTQRLGVVKLKRGTVEGQALILRKRKVLLSEIAEIGDRIELKAKTVSLGAYLFRCYFKP